MNSTAEQDREIAAYTHRSSDHFAIATSDWEMVKEAVNIYTDNLFNLFRYFSKNCPGVNGNDVRKSYGIAEDMDYLE